MSTKIERYRQVSGTLPDRSLGWNLYGAGLENIGRGGKPETFAIPEPGPDQLLVRIDSVGMCFSDVKIIRQGRHHPKLYNRDLTVEPTRLGHEVALTIVKAGENLRDRYHPGQRLAVQPDIYQDGMSTAYGYTVPGGLIQYHLIGPEVLVTDEGACLLPLEGELGYAEASLLEPWGCVLAAYTQRRRLTPKEGGLMWIIGQPGDKRRYTFSNGLEAPATVVLTDVPAPVRQLVEASGTEVIVRDGLHLETPAALSAEFSDGRGFDDIIVLKPRSASLVTEIAKVIARRGTMNLVGEEPLDGLVKADVGRLHYDYLAFVGTEGPDIAASYGEARNRCELKPRGVAVFVGAGGPMGQMHVQRAIELPEGPKLLIATEISDERLAAMRERFAPLAEAHKRQLIFYNPQTADQSLAELVSAHTDGIGADDAVVCVPVAGLMAEAASLLNPDGMLVLFAGVPKGTYAPVDMSAVYLNNAQYTGTSGLTMADQAMVMNRAQAGALSPARAVAAIGGMQVAVEGLQALMEGRYPGKIIIFPQIEDLPLMGLDELKEKLPEVAEKLGPGDVWTQAAEEALIEKFWLPAGGG